MRRIDIHTHFFPPEYFQEVFGRERADRVMQDEAGREVLVEYLRTLKSP